MHKSGLLIVPAKGTDGIHDRVHLPQGHTVYCLIQFMETCLDLVIVHAIFHQYFIAYQDDRAERLAKLIKYGTEDPTEIWMLRYGFSFEEIEWLKPCIDSIDQEEIIFNESIKNLSDAQKNSISKYVFFPMNCVRFVSINDNFDTVDGLTDQSNPHGSRIRIPIKNAFNEQVAAEIKQKVEATLQMKVERGAFIGPRAPFGYQKSEANHDQLVPDPIASITVRKIFDLAANGTGVTGIVRYLNEKGLPTPIQYARSNGLTGSFADGTGDWNSRSVNICRKYNTWI